MSAGRAARPALALALAALAALAAGCAYLPPVPDAMKVAAPSDSALAARPAPAAPPPARAQVDSLPSRDAAEVLATIPEPIPVGERVPAPEPAARPATGAARADSAATDSAAAAPSDTSAVPSEALPVPEPTRPLGDAPGTLGNAPLPDSLFLPAAPAAPPVAPGTAASPAAPDTCFRVQFTAPRDRKTAEAKQRAAESLLLTPCVIEPAAGLFKVRSRDCASRSTADVLQARARASGFEGAFRFAEKRR